MVQFSNAAIAAVTDLIAGAAMRQRGLPESSLEWQIFNAELEAYGRVLDVLLQLNESQPAQQRCSQLSIPRN